MLSALLVAGCGPQPDPGQAQPIDGMPRASQMAWSGTLSCADCEGIQVRLALSRDGHPPRYQLQETFRTRGRDARFTEEGVWWRDGPLLRLRGEEGGERTWALEADGSLTLREPDGAPPPGAVRLLRPEPVD